MDEVARDMFLDFVMQPPVPLVQLGSAIARVAPRRVKTALHSMVDTVKWLLAEDAADTVLDMEVMRALQQNCQTGPAPPRLAFIQSPCSSVASPASLPYSTPTSPTATPRRTARAGCRVSWSPTCEAISAEGEIERDLPLRPSADNCGPRRPEHNFGNIGLFPLVKPE